MKFLFTLLLICFLPQLAWCKQSYFKAEYLGDQVRFDYQWQDQTGKVQRLRFNLPQEELSRGVNEFKPFDQAGLNNYIMERVQEHLKLYNEGRKMIRLRRVRDGYDVEYRGYTKADIRKIQSEIDVVSAEARTKFIKDNFYNYVNTTSVMPDHRRIAKRYVRAMQPVAEAIKQQTRGMGVRETVDYALNFLQSIPYNELKDRYTSNGAGFYTPYGMLYKNLGDCDTKSVALAAIIRNLYPQVRMVIIYTPGHAFIGLGFNPASDDLTLTLGGHKFVLAEPAGPGLVGIGQVSPSSTAQLKRSHYSYQEVPY